ncbi:MAG: phosphoribosylformylglycinamidine synthase subunit PurL [Planctomycetota bacterium]|nr:phosphoribosylformylglycinamidine synthase subunit PurL [Planctomycetota bacterium]
MPSSVHRIEVRPQPGHPDPRGDAACRDAASLGFSNPPSRIETTAVYLIQGRLHAQQVRQLAEELLADPVLETATIGAAPPTSDTLIEVHPLPGVMDPDAEAVELAIRAMLGAHVEVRTARRYDLHGTDASTARLVAERCLANTVIHSIHDQPYHPEAFVAGSPHDLCIVSVPLSELDDAALVKLSRKAHFFLSLDEMKSIQAEYRRLGSDPREIELETIAQTWSEHCVHKTLKSTIRYQEQITDAQSPRIPIRGRPGHEINPDGSITIHNLFKSTIVAATEQLIADGVDWCPSVFVDNAGVIAFDDDHAVCFKVETHNHPSAIEPYGGAATGIGGCIRDIIGTGLAAKPIAATDVFCVAYPDHWSQSPRRARRRLPAQVRQLPNGCLHPRRILTEVVAGVRDYGNRMGIPTLNGAVWFDDDYVGNPLVFCGCIGVMQRKKISGDPQPGDRIVVIGGRTGRDGIHGATFSSAQLTDTHADEFSHAVQIGNAVTEKKLLDAILEARDHPQGCLFHAITDCGAGGFSSAVGEMGRHLGAEVHLDRAPLKYEGLSPTEIWISEAQERMVLAVPPRNVDQLRAICNLHEAEMCELGQFGTDGQELILRYEGREVGRLSMNFLHEGLPQLTREATWNPPVSRGLDSPPLAAGDRPNSIADTLLRLLAHPNIASKRWIIRQYDHEVQGGSIIKPLVGPEGDGPSDAAVILPLLDSTRGLAIANGLATGLRDDPYLMALAAIDECVRNLVCVGADPSRIALLDNFCWPSCDDPRNLGALVRAAEACYDGALAYRAPFISGKDSLNNQFTTSDGKTIEIPPTLLISGIGTVPDVSRCVTMDAKESGNLLLVVGCPASSAIGGSHFEMLSGDSEAGHSPLPAVDLNVAPRIARLVAGLINDGLVSSAHDCSEGGLLVAAAEMTIASGLGLQLDLADLPAEDDPPLEHRCFCEQPARYLLEIRPDDLAEVSSRLHDLPGAVIGTFNSSSRLTLAGDQLDVSVKELQAAWLGTLDW